MVEKRENQKKKFRENLWLSLIIFSKNKNLSKRNEKK